MQQFTETQCCRCGIAFKVPRDYLTNRREDGEDFYCPNGHQLHFGDSELKKTKRILLEALRKLNATTDELNLLKGIDPPRKLDS